MDDPLRDEIERDFVVERGGWVGERLARVSDRLQPSVPPHERFELLVVWWSDYNAFTTFGRTIYLSRRLFELLPDDDAAAFIVAHELAHHQLGHLPRFLPGVTVWRHLPELAIAVLNRFVCRRVERELAADATAIALCVGAGYSAERCVEALRILLATALDYRDLEGAWGADGRTHPSLERRIESLRPWLARDMHGRWT